MTNILEDEIGKALRRLRKCFDEKNGELAYLALTSKPEFVIRDRLAFDLHKKLRRRKMIVAREWSWKKNRIDLAILNNNVREPSRPEALVELKTASLFVFCNEERASKELEKIKKDLNKCKGVSRVYALLLATHINQVPDECYEGVVKYRSKPQWCWKKAFEVYQMAKKVEAEAKKVINNELKRRKLASIKEGRIQAGEAFRTNVSVLYWLIQMK